MLIANFRTAKIARVVLATTNIISARWAGNPELHAKMLAWKARKVPMRVDWNAVKVGVMEEFMTYKYTQNKRLKTLLLSTGSK